MTDWNRNIADYGLKMGTHLQLNVHPPFRSLGRDPELQPDMPTLRSTGCIKLALDV